MLRSLRTLRSIPRIKDIAFILGKHGFHQVAGALQAPVTSRLRRVFKREPRQAIAQPERQVPGGPVAWLAPAPGPAPLSSEQGAGAASGRAAPEAT